MIQINKKEYKISHGYYISRVTTDQNKNTDLGQVIIMTQSFENTDLINNDLAAFYMYFWSPNRILRLLAKTHIHPDSI